VVKRIVVGAHYGTGDWLVQRATALVMAAYAVLFAVLMLTASPAGYDDWRALFAPRWMQLATFVFFLSLFWHAWVGVRDILMDYVKPAGMRLALLGLVAVVLVAYAGWAIQILQSV
jgi:succinate dehydrogenase / fumarate reductase membrane anchor subunit